MWFIKIRNLLLANIITLSIPSILFLGISGCVAKTETAAREISSSTPVTKNTVKVTEKKTSNTTNKTQNKVKTSELAIEQKFPMGINLSSDVSWSRSKMWINIAKSARDWGYVDKPYQPNPDLKLSAQGYPLSDAGLFFEGYEYQPGVWQFSYQGSGEISFTAGGSLIEVNRRADGTVRGTFDRSAKMRADGSLIPVHLMLKNIDPNNPPSNLKIVAAGYDLDSDAIYTQEFLNFIKPFKILRYMDLMETNESTIKTWGDRLKPNAPGKGVAFEDLIALSNITNKEAWITLPHLADDEYIRQTARLFAQQYNPNLNLYLENSNELWNRSFSQSRDFHASTIDKLMREEGLSPAAATAKVEKEGITQKAVVDRLCHISNIFRQEFGTKADKIKPVLAGQAANSWHIKKGLEHLAATGQQENCNLDGIAIAPYLNTQYGPEFNPTSVDEVFEEMEAYYQARVKPWITEHAQLAKQYNLKLYAYEGGQHLNGENALDIKIAAQNDPRMGTLLKDYFCFWQDSGGEDFVFFSSINDHSKYGHWGLKTSINEGETVKHRAVMDMLKPGSCL
ncbi:hypothetical protein NIES4102_11120 [Chondrocystis sp. NIES-4102]|nr:hypothetical protein NIES4102_11120 [Chondrocystis sp. NIES-4102]